MERFRKLQDEEIFWNSIREYVKERDNRDNCAFCDSSENLALEHLFPRSHGGPDQEKNVTWICGRCNSSKGGKRLYEYWTSQNGLEAAKYDVPRLVEGKYLKFVFEALLPTGFLDFSVNQIRKELCPRCDLSSLCMKEASLRKLSPLCLDGATALALSKF